MKVFVYIITNKKFTINNMTVEQAINQALQQIYEKLLEYTED